MSSDIQDNRIDANNLGGSGSEAANRLSGFQETAEPNLGVAQRDPELSLQSNLEVNMKMVKSLILGSAAGLIAMGGAQAADLPVKAKAVEYVRICSLYGAGFFYMPGTDTCIKLGGYLRAETAFNSSALRLCVRRTRWRAQPPVAITTPLRSRQNLTVDTRTATEYGVVRTFADVSSPGPVVRTPAPAPVVPRTARRSATVYNSSTGHRWRRARYLLCVHPVRWVHVRSDAFRSSTRRGQSYPAGSPDALPGGSNHVTGVNQVTYTAQFGNGISGTMSAAGPDAFTTIEHLEPDRALRPAGMLSGAESVVNSLGWHARSGSDRRYSRSTKPGVCSSCRLWRITTMRVTTARPSPPVIPSISGAGQFRAPCDQELPTGRGRRHQHAGRLYGRCKPLQFPKLVPDQLRDVWWH